MISNEQLTILQAIKPTPDQVLQLVGLYDELPVNPLEIAKRLGINCLTKTTDEIIKIVGNNIRGISFFEDNSYVILYSKDWHHYAQRFVIAYELGNVLLHKDYLPINCLHPKYHQLNLAANHFAVNLLMPLRFVKRYYMLTLEQISQIFDVTPTAANIRLNSIG